MNNIIHSTVKYSKFDVKPEGLRIFEYLQKQNQNVLCAAIQHFDFLGSHYYYQSDTQTYFKIVVDDDNHVIVCADETSFVVEFVDKILDMCDRGYTFNSIQKYIENVYSKNYGYMGRNRL